MQEFTTPSAKAQALVAPCGPDHALLALGEALKRRGYHFVTVTPLSHQRVLARPPAARPGLRDIFGWNHAFTTQDIAPELLDYLRTAGALTEHGGLRSSVRFSSLGGQLFLHSGFPTVQEDAVFFGPDTYRFANAIRAIVAELPPGPLRVLDIGAGSGAGGLHAAELLRPREAQIVLTDINAQALRACRINARLNGFPGADVLYSDLYRNVQGPFDLIISNPPYLVDKLERTYRHGGGALGARLSLRIACEGWPHLAPGGRLLLYTGSAIVNGVDLFEAELRAQLPPEAQLAYREIDPDVFGEELETPPYHRADRIAAVAAAICRD